MGKRGPKRGSRAFWHRKRAPRIVPRIRFWRELSEAGLEGFAGYKAGMTHAMLIEDRDTPLKGQEVSRAVTVIETPPLFIYSVIAFRATPFGPQTLFEIPAVAGVPKEFERLMPKPKKSKIGLDALDSRMSEIADLRVRALTEPWKTRFGKKTPDVVEIGLGGKTVSEKIGFAKQVFGKEVSVSEVFKEGEFFDAVAVTKGFGWQGVVKRYGVSLNPRKASKARRHGGAIGPEKQAKVMYTIPRAGQTGFQRRTDRNKRVLKISKNADEVSEKGVLSHYGRLASDFVLVDGSVPGPRKRFVFLKKVSQPVKKPEIRAVVKQNG